MRAYYVRDREDEQWCIAGAPNQRSLCGRRAAGHAWPHTEHVLQEGETVCSACTEKMTVRI